MYDEKNCPVAFQSAYLGKEKYPTIVLDTMADHNLQFWHTVFGFAGSCNDINVLDASPLRNCFVTGTHSCIDFDYAIGNDCVFSSQITWWMAFPPLSHFVKTISIPISLKGKAFAGANTWQRILGCGP